MSTQQASIKSSLFLGKRGLGFTLLEMLLILVVIASMLAYSTTLFKQQHNSDIVDKTSGEMIQLLQASQGYLRDSIKGYWPNDINALVNDGRFAGLPRCGALFLGSTTNNTDNCNRYNPYTLTFPEGTSSGEPNIKNLPKADQVIISTIAPNLTMAKAIAAKLPNGSVDTRTNEVSGFVYLPGYAQVGDLAQIMAKQKIFIVKTVYTDLLGKNDANLTGDNNLSKNMKNKRYLTLTLPTDCPAKWTPDYDVALNQFAINKDSSKSSFRGVYICKVPGDNSAQRRITVKVDRNILDDWYSAGVMIITYCRPPGVDSLSWNGYDKSKQANLASDASQCNFGPY